MELQLNEHIIFHMNKKLEARPQVILTNLRLIQRGYDSGFRFEKIIPLNHISYLELQYHNHMFYLLVCAVFALGYYATDKFLNFFIEYKPYILDSLMAFIILFAAIYILSIKIEIKAVSTSGEPMKIASRFRYKRIKELFQLIQRRHS